MKTVKIKSNKISDEQIEQIASYLKQSKVMAYPTDTVYGLGCLARSRQAVKKVHQIKRRIKKKGFQLRPIGEKPLLVLVSDYKMLVQYCKVGSKQLKYLKKVWPGPVTVILRLKKKMPKELTGGLHTLAVRLPKNEFLIKIIKTVGQPIVSTSLNLVGDKPLTSVAGLNDYFKKVKPDLVIDAGIIKGRPSKLIDLTDVNNIKVLRK